MRYYALFLAAIYLQSCGSNSNDLRSRPLVRQQPISNDQQGIEHDDAEIPPVVDEDQEPIENPTDPDPEPEVIEPDANLTFRTLAAMNPRTDSPAGTKLRDIVTHLPSSFGNTYFDEDEITWGHETSHAIHAHIRNSLAGAPRNNGFYVLSNRYVVIPEPNIRKRDAVAYVPQSLRGSRFALYMEGQTAWDDTPLYVWDEWNAYVNGSEVGVELVQKGLWDRGGRDGVAGALEFNAYAIAVVMAAYNKDQNILSTNKTLIEFLAFNLRRSMEVFLVGKDLPVFKQTDQEQRWQNFLNNSDAAAMRAFLVKLYGKAWCQRTFGNGAW